MTNEPHHSIRLSKVPLQKAFGLKLQSLRRKLGMTQESFAEKLDRSVDTISALERGLTFASLDTLMRIAEIMECSLEELFSFDPQAKPKRKSDIDEIIALLEEQPSDIRAAALARVKRI